MTSVLVTGSADCLGYAAAATLVAQGHQVIVHTRNEERLGAVEDLLRQGANSVVADLAHLDQTHALAEHVTQLGGVDAVIHNAGVYRGRDVMPVNVVAPYVLTVLLPTASRLVYLSSGMHHGARADVANVDWAGATAGSYPDSKLFVAALSAAVARLWPTVISSTVDPGWVPTRMGGPGAPDDLQLGHRTLDWLATSDDEAAATTGGYWYHQRLRVPDAAVNDVTFQGRFLSALERHTGLTLPERT